MTLICDQAIFTSIRSPMGEGYRIVAASRGLRPEEKQVITRHSPSHEGLCCPGGDAENPPGQTPAAAFYALPTGRLCVALSCLAGAEHTGRGGQRVYTHCVVFVESEFPSCSYNPFILWRAMRAAGFDTPQLKPQTVLPDVALDLAIGQRDGDRGPTDSSPISSLDSIHRKYLLNSLLTSRRLILNVPGDWLTLAEWLLLGIPGPMRAKISFAAGLKFSVSHPYQLHLLHDEKSTTKTKITGQKIEMMEPSAGGDSSRYILKETSSPAWVSFVDRLWDKRDPFTLARRTSRSIVEVGPVGRERVGKLYNFLDGLPQAEVGILLSGIAELLDRKADGVEQEIIAEIVTQTAATLRQKIGVMNWAGIKPYWSVLVGMRKRSEFQRAFVQPIIQTALRVVMREDPISAAESALDVVATDSTSPPMQPAEPMLFEELLDRLAMFMDGSPTVDADRLLRIIRQWTPLRPDCAFLARLRQRCAQPIASTTS